MALDEISALDTSHILGCDQEPIRIPGTIQPHGILFVLTPTSLVIEQVSSNAGRILTVSCGDVVGKNLGDVLCSGSLKLVGSLRDYAGDGSPAPLGTARLASKTYSILVHRAGPSLILELEEVDHQARGSLDSLYPQIRGFVEDLQKADTVETLNNTAVAQIRALTEFDRVMVYRFDDQWNGTVVAEDRNDALPAYLDLHFPASDIPAQARDLYRLNRLRIIPDAGYQPVPIAPSRNPVTGAVLDMSFSALRSVSPVHVEYMQNMGTPASMSISIVIDGELWGLISCHHSRPKRVAPHVRTACDFLGQILGMQISAKSRAAEALQRVVYQEIQSHLLATMAGEDPFINGLKKNPVELLSLVGATGAAVVFDGNIQSFGAAPSVDDIARVVKWLWSEHQDDDCFFTDRLGTEPGLGALTVHASGLGAIPISKLHPSYILWFRPEVIQTVTWGGDPRKTTAAAEERLHPRKSFEQWKETVRARSLPWTQVQIDTACAFRNAIVGIVLRKAEELAALNEELTRSNKELEAFSYSVSHDLRAPFRHIVGYAELLKEQKDDRLSPRALRYIDIIIESSFSAGKLVDDLLGFSQMGRTVVVPINVDMSRLVREVLSVLDQETKDRKIEWRIGELLPLRGDPGMLRQLMQNLISNAIKYTRSRDPAIISIDSKSASHETTYTVTDNGVGFDMAYVDKLFGVFQRLHRMEDFEGTGIGLANVKRIVERHGGRVWAEGAVDQGAKFFFSIPHEGRT